MKLYQGDALELLETIKPVKAIFCDPPDNLGLKYDGFIDKKDDYYGWIERLILRVLLKCEVFWLSYYHDHDLEVKHIIRQILRTRHPSWTCKEFLWIYTFSQYCDTDCAHSFRPILRLTRPGAKLYPDAIRGMSDRMLANDPRASGLRVPNNLWNFPRIVGNAKERRTWHPTQHPEALVKQMKDFSCQGDEVWLDCFIGSGTSFRVGGNVIGFEISDAYCTQLELEHGVKRDSTM